MRRLLYVPILHAEADLGSLSPALSRHSAARSGEERWAQHGEVLRRFWQSIARYLLSLDAAGLCLYQDGLAAGGEVGLRIAQEAARRGSPNYQLILELVHRGAALRQTEDPALLLEEQQDLLRMLGLMEPVGEGSGSRRDRLMEDRDRFIATTINQTLREGETGVLFLGAYHDVAPRLGPDIEVRWVKEQAKVRAYLQALLFKGDEARWQALADYLSAPVL